jgi:hypothetical protein
MTFTEFCDAANRLRDLDNHMVPFLDDEAWPRFRDDPVRFTLSPKNCHYAERIWAAAQGMVGESLQ